MPGARPGAADPPAPQAVAAARVIWDCWQSGRTIRALPADLKPADAAAGHRIQAALPIVSQRAVLGWKLAATNPSGQAHIGVDSPIPGRLLEGQVLCAGATIDLSANRMRVAEAEFGFKLGADLPPRDDQYTVDEVLNAAASVHPCIEFPDSRFSDFAAAGPAQLAADCACAQWFVAGPAATQAWRDLDLAAHTIRLSVNGQERINATGADVLGGPANALCWLANAHAATGGLKAGQIVTTGVCGRPQAIKPGDTVEVDLGSLGCVLARTS